MSYLLPSRRAAFIHVPRTAGTSMESLLKDAGWISRRRYHAPMSNLNLPKDWFSFGFVRNPWARLLSFYLLSGGTTDMRRFDPFLRVMMSAWSYLEPGVSFVGRYENLPDDWSHVAKFLDLPVNLPRLNGSLLIDDYRPYYSDAQAQYVSNLCQEDIKRFGYCF